MMELAGSKLRAKLGSSLNESASGNEISDFAQRQLQKTGWTRGEGLGKNRQGISTHLTVKRRPDQVGLGHVVNNNNTTTNHQEWWKDCIGDTLTKLSSSSGGSGGGKANKRKRHATDQELFEATGGARFGMRAQLPAKAKWARTESSITDQEEKEAQARVEWNGTKMTLHNNKRSTKCETTTQVANSDATTTTTTTTTTTSSSGANETSETEMKKVFKKKQKKDKKRRKTEKRCSEPTKQSF